MTEKPPPASDYDALAKRYLDLWQQQVAKLAQDPAQLSGSAAAWSQMAAAMMKNVSPAAPTASAHDGSSKSPNASPVGTPAPQSPHGNGGVDLADVVGRLDALERRLAVLEGAAKPARPARSAAPRRRAKPGEP